jgi:galactonate dehydratase
MLMRIVDLRAHVCFAMWRNWVFVEVETEDGLIGVGEATLEGREATMLGHLEDIRRYLVGRDASSIAEHSWNLVRDPFWVGGYVGMTGVAAVETALWDLLGQRLGVPVWQLQGGRVRDRVRVYANGWYFGAETVEQWAERAGEVVELGYTALKFDPFGRSGPLIEHGELEQVVAIVQAVRRVAGPAVDLLIEGHGRFDIASALRIARALEGFDCFWFEEPITPGNVAALAHLGRATSIPIATGERLYSRYDYRELLESHAAAIIQPDVIHAGGISETLRIAALAEIWQVSVAPHNPNGPVATAATLVIDAVIPNFVIQEMLAPWDAEWRHQVVEGCPSVCDGYLTIPDRPGLGVTLNIQEILKHPYQPIDLSLFTEASVLERVELHPSAH